MARSQNYSEVTAQKIDHKIFEIVDEQYQRSLAILNDKRAALDLCAEALLEHETIDGKHVLEILEFGEIRSPIVKREAAAEPDAEPQDLPADQPQESDDPQDDGLAGEQAPAGAPA